MMTITSRSIAAVAAASIAMTLAAPAAHADGGAMTVSAVRVQSLDTERVTNGRGAGAEMVFVCGCKHMFFTVGGFASLGERAPVLAARTVDAELAPLARDIYDIHVNIGLTPAKRRTALSPFASVGIDFLYLNTELPDRSSASGITMGMNARAGVFGMVGKGWFYHASASYVGAVVPGTGEGLDGVVLQLGVGRHTFD